MIFINVFGKMDEKIPEKFFFLFNYDFQVHWPILLRFFASLYFAYKRKGLIAMFSGSQE